MIERRKYPRPPHVVNMEQMANAMRWQELTKKKWAEEDKRKK